MFTDSLRSLVRVGNVLLAVGLLIGCASTPAAQIDPTAPPAPATAVPPAPTTAAANPTPATTTATGPTAPAAAQSDAEIKQGIQQTLDLYAKAYNDNDPDLLKQAADQTNAPFRRFIQTRFETRQKSVFAGGGGYGYTIRGDIKPRELGFVEAQVEDLRSRGVYDWTFRNVNGKWLMSEPTEEQIGKREKIETEHFTFYTYPWAKDITPTLMRLTEEARQHVLTRLGKVPDKKVNIYIKPIYGISPADTPGALAYYDRNNRGTPRLVISAPHSYVFQAYDPSKGWENELEGNLAHEYTHLVNDALFTPIVRMADWMYEGVAEYVANDRRDQLISVVRAAMSSNQLIPIVDTSGRVDKQDIGHIYTLEKDAFLAYGEGYLLVEYIDKQYGGLDGFWKMAAIYDKTQDLNASLQQAFGVSYDQFDKDWQAWLQENYS